MAARVVLVIALFSASAFAEDFKEAVTVTASRTPVPVEETGNSVTVIERDEIEARQSLFVADLLRGVPGLAVSRSGPAGSLTQVRLRGAEANQVRVSIDGIAVNDVFAGDELPLELLTPYDVQRIEIVRGPQSGLWGADALAGAINIITDDGSAGSDIRFETGSFGTLRGAGRYSLRRNAVSFAVSGSYVDVDGTNVARVGDEKDGASNATGSMRFGWHPENRPVEIDVTGRRTEADAETDAIDFLTTGLPRDADRSTDTELSLFGATARWTPAGSAWSHEARLARASSDTVSFDASVRTDSTAMDKYDASWESTVALGDRRADVRHGLTFAVDHEGRDFSQRGGATPFGDPNQDRDMHTTGAVVEYRVAHPQHWSVSAVLRHDRNSDFDDVTTYRATGSYVVSEATRVRAGVGSGHKTPTFIERYGFFSDGFAGNDQLRPEKSTEWEVGVDRRITAGSRIELTYFNGRLRDEINGFVFDPGLGAFTARNESGASRRQGAELAVHSSLGDRVQLHGSYTYTDATEPGVSGDDGELRRPRHSGSVRLRYRPERLPLDLSFSAVRTGSQIDSFFPPFPLPPERVRQPAYLLADVTARYRVGSQVELIGRVENALDEDYEDVFGFATPGLGVYAGLSYSPRSTR